MSSTRNRRFAMKKTSVIISVMLMFLFGASIWWNNGLNAVDKENTTPQMVVIQKGTSLRQIAFDLKTKGLIKDPVAFFLYAKQKGIDRKIQAGDFRLSPAMSAREIAQSLTQGNVDIWVTIPEGKRADEIADILREKIPSYQEEWRIELNTREGYLFPDTYLIPKDASIESIITTLQDTFKQKYQIIENKTIYSQKDIVTIASLIEREAKHDVDRPLVSSVIHNRLRIGMKLDLDATIQYALGYQSPEKSWWKKNLTIQDIRLNSLYNTYRNAGLPPTPIANPGLKSLQAATSPQATNYLYYISDKTGVNHYAATLEEHNANITKYGL